MLKGAGGRHVLGSRLIYSRRKEDKKMIRGAKDEGIMVENLHGWMFKKKWGAYGLA